MKALLTIALAVFSLNASAINFPHIEIGGSVGKFLGKYTNPLKPHAGLIVGAALGGLPVGIVLQLGQEVDKDLKAKRKENKRLRQELNEWKNKYLTKAEEKEEMYTALIIAEGRAELVNDALDNLKAYFNEYLECTKGAGESRLEAKECYRDYYRRVKEEYRSVAVEDS